MLTDEDNIIRISAASLTAITDMERQLGRREGWVEAMMKGAPIPVGEPMRLRWRAQHELDAEKRFPLPEPFR